MTYNSEVGGLDFDAPPGHFIFGPAFCFQYIVGSVLYLGKTTGKSRPEKPENTFRGVKDESGSEQILRRSLCRFRMSYVSVE